MGIKSDKKIQTKHLKGSRSFFAKEKEKVGLLVGRFEVPIYWKKGKPGFICCRTG